ncbi:hypothetical protein D6C77_02415 [Aureobasidium pullulans]|nr:hypothetical protein D6C77_02415 [Aureobasidium pullulans]
MVGQSTSIQSFFSTRTSPTKVIPPESSPVPGDGFTAEELDNALLPVRQDNWTPRGVYDEYEIDALMFGLNRVKIVGRLVNIFESSHTTKLPKGLGGSVHLVIKDDTGAVTVSIRFVVYSTTHTNRSKIRLSYTLPPTELRLGRLVAVWATYVANGDRGSFPCAVAPLYIKIFPEKDKSCRIRVLEGAEFANLCRKPLNYQPTLMSLKAFARGGSEVIDAKILVVVKSVSARKRVTKKDGTEAYVTRVVLMDDTEEATLSLWDTTSTTPNDWQPSHTALLISSPSLNVSHKNWLALASDTFVDADPCIPEAERLRGFAGRKVKREHINPTFPYEEYALWSIIKPNERVLYSLADVDDRARENPGEIFEGYLSMMIMDLNMTTLRQQNMLMCNECCGIPIYANAKVAKCKHCESQVSLRVNPRLIGKLVDESGCITSGKLVLSDHAWTRLLGRSAQELIESSASTLKSVEHRMLHIRITLRFWWSEEVGKLVISEVLE